MVLSLLSRVPGDAIAALLFPDPWVDAKSRFTVGFFNPYRCRDIGIEIQKYRSPVEFYNLHHRSFSLQKLWVLLFGSSQASGFRGGSQRQPWDLRRFIRRSTLFLTGRCPASPAPRRIRKVEPPILVCSTPMYDMGVFKNWGSHFGVFMLVILLVSVHIRCASFLETRLFSHKDPPSS